MASNYLTNSSGLPLDLFHCKVENNSLWNPNTIEEILHGMVNISLRLHWEDMNISKLYDKNLSAGKLVLFLTFVTRKS